MILVTSKNKLYLFTRVNEVDWSEEGFVSKGNTVYEVVKVPYGGTIGNPRATLTFEPLDGYARFYIPMGQVECWGELNEDSNIVVEFKEYINLQTKE